MNAKILNALIRARVRQSAAKGIVPDVLLDGICKTYGHVSQEDFDNAVFSLSDIKMSGLRLYDAHYVCSCGKVKNIPDPFYCADCTADWKNSLRLDA